MYNVIATKSYVDGERDLDPVAFRSARRVIGQLRSDPHARNLHRHKVEGARAGIFSCYVGKRGHRLIVQEAGLRTLLLLLVGAHDPVYRRAERMTLRRAHGVLSVWEIDPVDGAPTPYEEIRHREGRLCIGIDNKQLAAGGLPEASIEQIRRLNTLDELKELVDAGSLPLEIADMVTAVLKRPAIDRVPNEGPATGEDISEVELMAALQERQSLAEFVPVDDLDLEAALSRPIEDWMIFLHPDQREITERAFGGPARVKGAAGTGKTVVLLHRARQVAKANTSHRVLVLTYSDTQPAILRSLMERLAPKLVGQIEFSGIHRWAQTLLKERGSKLVVDSGRVEAAFNEAWRGLGDELARAGFPVGYCREEIDWVIGGRGVEDQAEYASMSRRGRHTALSPSHRMHMWELYERYRRNLRRKGLSDSNDVLRRALDSLTKSPIPSVSAVLVDEAQDLNELALRLAHAAARQSNGRHALMLFGDGKQALYPGGYSLRAAGVDVLGRSMALRTSYRSTWEILNFAEQATSDVAADEGDDQVLAGARDVECSRHGEPPTLYKAHDADDLTLALGQATEKLLQSGAVRPGDVGVLVPSNSSVDRYRRELERIDFVTMDLARYGGTHVQKIRVGTYERAKGLEFKAVLLPGVDAASLRLAQLPHESAGAYIERRALIRRRLYVAMTRARDVLWLGAIGDFPEFVRTR